MTLERDPRNEKGVKRVFKCISLILFIFCFTVSVSQAARSVSFSWTVNNDDPSIDGYRLYYKIGGQGSSLADYNGTDVDGGNSSPIEISGKDTTDYVLSNLSETDSYSFVLTAFRGSEESSPTQVISLAAETPQLETRSPAFAWEQNTDDPAVDGYLLYYKIGDPGANLADYNGTDASGQNPSPIQIQGVDTTSYSLQNLLKSEKYSFVLTSYRGEDESNATDPIVLEASDVNNAPSATAFVINVIDNVLHGGQLSGSDPDNDPLTYHLVNMPQHGTVEITDASSGSFTYIAANNNQNGTDTFSFKVNDGKVDSSSATITINITASNGVPVANGGAISVNEDAVYSGLLSATDGDNDPLTFSIVSYPGKGAVSITDTKTGAFRYTPNNDVNGSDSFTFKVTDGKSESNTATISVQIASINDAPIATASAFSTDEDQKLNGSLTGSDVDSTSLNYQLVHSGNKGTAVITNSSSGLFSYTPNENVNGSDTFSFKINDGAADSNTAVVTVTIKGVNDAPTASQATIAVIEDTPYTGGLSANDSDDDPLTFTLVSSGSKGTVQITDGSTGAFTYTPNPDVTGSDVFLYRVSDGQSNSANTEITVSISSVNDAPVAFADSVATPMDTAYFGQLAASDVEGDPLTYSVVSNGSLGFVEIIDAKKGTYSYTPEQGSTGNDTFSFKVNDGSMDSPDAIVVVNVTDDTIITSEFGDATESDFPGTIADSYINVNDNNYGVSESLITYSWSPSSPMKVANTIVMKIDLSSIPEGASVVDAQLHLYQTNATGGGEFVHGIHRIVDVDPQIGEVTGFDAAAGTPWSPVPEGATYNDIPLGLGNIAEQEDAVVVDAQNGYRSWDVTNMVNVWVNDPQLNNGLLIKGAENQSEIGHFFASSDHTDANVRPKLIVRYTMRPAAPELIMIEEIR